MRPERASMSIYPWWLCTLTPSLHLQHAPICSTVANRPRWFLETTLHPHILGIWRGFTISGLHNRTESTVQASSSMDHTLKRASLECDRFPANHWFPWSHLGRQLQNFRDLLTVVWRISGTTLDRKTLTFAGKSSGTLFGRACSVTLS